MLWAPSWSHLRGWLHFNHSILQSTPTTKTGHSCQYYLRNFIPQFSDCFRFTLPNTIYKGIDEPRRIQKESFKSYQGKASTDRERSSWKEGQKDTSATDRRVGVKRNVRRTQALLTGKGEETKGNNCQGSNSGFIDKTGNAFKDQVTPTTAQLHLIINQTI